ncbi:MAG: hypothetical protein M0P73_03965 [Syntrophobacterales bacterium]|jgi:hypothetical protein|nr:hypothetical protein [Syntrophobacterales bacterium]
MPVTRRAASSRIENRDAVGFRPLKLVAATWVSKSTILQYPHAGLLPPVK